MRSFGRLKIMGLFFALSFVAALDQAMGQAPHTGPTKSLSSPTSQRVQPSRARVQRAQPRRVQPQANLTKEARNLAPTREATVTTDAKALKPETRPWGLTLGYEILTDFAENTQPRSYRHRLDIMGMYNFLPTTMIWSGVSANIEGHQNGDVVMDQQNKDSLISDFRLGLRHSLVLDDSNTLSLGLDNTFPTSTLSQMEGYKSITGAETRLATQLMSFWSLRSSLRGTYIWNSFEKSSTLAVNRESLVDLGLRSVWTLGYGIYTGLGGGVRYTTFLDKATDISFQNSVSLGYTYKTFFVDLSYINGSYADQSDVDLFFVDKYRQLTKLAVGYSF